MKQYQFIVFMQDSDYDDIEKQVKEFFGIDDITYAFQYKECFDYAIELLSQWDYGEYYEDPVNENDFLHEIGSAADIYYSDKSDYVLITYGLMSAIGLYRI